MSTWKPEPNSSNSKAPKQCPPTPLVVVEMGTGEESNIFTRTEPGVKIAVKNWKAGELTGKIAGEVSDATDKVVQQFEQPVTIASSAAINVPLKLEATMASTS